jgi:thioesterase domain-containing protein
MDLSARRTALAAVWADRMPITQALGITVARLDATGLTLELPLAPNRNHKGTAFAGSLSALATLAGWSAIWLLLADADEVAHVVIQDASVRYLAPARSDVTATVDFPTVHTWQKALVTLRRRGRARLGLVVQVHDSGQQLVAAFAGRYVIHRGEELSGETPATGLP